MFQYLKDIDELSRKVCKAKTKEDFLSLDQIEEALKVNVAFKLNRVAALQKEHYNVSKKDFVNSLFAADIVNMSQTHIKYVTFWTFRKRIERGDIKCKGNLHNLTNLCKLYGLYQLHNDCKSCYECGYFQAGTAFSELILNAMKAVNLELRP